MSPEIVTPLLFISLTVCLLLGLPLAFCMGALGLIFGIGYLGTSAFYVLVSTTYTEWTSYVLLAAPLFMLMGNFLQRSGIAEDLYQSLYEWAGPLKGGLAIATIIICAIFAAMAGISAVGTITMGMIALPSMLKRNYRPSIAVGCISAGGTLGILIPPSVIMIIYGMMAEVSVGKLFMAGVLPGVLMTAVFIAYIAARAFINPNICPSIDAEEVVPLKERIVHLRALILPILLIILVLGVIYLGLCTPTEAAAIGAFGSFLCLVIKRRATIAIMRESFLSTLKMACMIMWIILGAKVFAHIYAFSGASGMLVKLVLGFGLNRWVIIIISQLVMILLGMFLDPVGIMLLAVPVFLPIIKSIGFDPIWFGILLTINMELGYITPPFGFNLFYMAPLAAPYGITMKDIYLSIIPFVALEAAGLAMVMIWPQIALWLPATMAAQ